MIDPDRLVAEADLPGVRGLALAGSFARGEPTAWSDIDVLRYVAAPPAPRGEARYIGDRLLRISSQTMAEAFAELERPERAIWAVLPTRSLRILVDRHGDLARLRERAHAFRWERLAAAGASWASERVAKDAENVLKLRAAIDSRDESAALNAYLNLAAHCTDAVAVALGVLVPTENAYHAAVRDVAGSAWTAAQRSAHGLDGGDIFARAAGARELYAATVGRLRAVLDRAALAVADRVLAATA